MMDWTRVDALVIEQLGRTFPAAQLEIHLRGMPVCSRVYGFVDPDTRKQETNTATRFDLASVSKLFTVTACMTLVQEGRIQLDQPVREILAEFSGMRPIEPYPDPLQTGAVVQVVPETGAVVDAGQVTVRNLLAHNSGLPAWLPLWPMETTAQMRAAALGARFAYATGARVVYSDIGLILLGMALEAVANRPLDLLVRERVTVPLGLDSITYGPLPCENVAPTEFYQRLGRRVCGEVHDENAFHLGGVAGHAGLFGTARDVAALGAMYLNGGAPLLAPALVAEMTRLQAQDGAVRRGVGFALWSPDPEASSNPLSQKAFGHLGFTGTSLWVDPERDLVVAFLTNRVYYGRENATAMGNVRVALHRTIAEIVDHEPSPRN